MELAVAIAVWGLCGEVLNLQENRKEAVKGSYAYLYM
jgi:hypothetical protein